jgi:hypothetical protein
MNGLPGKRELSIHLQAIMESRGEVVPKTNCGLVFMSLVMFMMSFFCLGVPVLTTGLDALVREIQNQLQISSFPTVLILMSLYVIGFAIFLIVRLPWVVFLGDVRVNDNLNELLSGAKLLDGRILKIDSVGVPGGKSRYKLTFDVIFDNGAIIQADYTTETKFDVKSGEHIKLLFLTRGLIVPMVF